MEIILLQDVENLGDKGQLANVARGDARNYLIPRKMAEARYTGQDRRVPSSRRRAQGAGLEARMAAQAEEFDGHAQQDRHHAGRQGRRGRPPLRQHHRRRYRRRHQGRGITIDKRKVLLEEPIKEVGTFMVDVEVAEGFVATVKTIVAPA